MTDTLPGHRVIGRLSTGARIVLRTEFGGLGASTRILRTPVQLEFAPLVEEAVLGAQGVTAGLPREIGDTLVGYGVRRQLGPLPGLPTPLAAGVLPHHPELPDLEAAPAGWGWPWITTSWAEGTSIDRAWPQLSAELRQRVAVRLLALVSSLHERCVVHGDIKPANIIVGPDLRVFLIDLDTLRRVPGRGSPVPTTDLSHHFAAPEQVDTKRRLTYLSSDSWALGMTIQQLGTGWRPESGVPAPTLPTPWSLLVGECRVEDPTRRKDGVALRSWFEATLAAPVPEGTVRVADAVAPGRVFSGSQMAPTQSRPAGPARAGEPESDGTVRVADVGSRPAPAPSIPRQAGTDGLVETVRMTGARRRRPWLWALLFAGAFSLLWIGISLRQGNARSARGRDLAEGAASRLRQYKTDPAVNRDATALPAVRAILEESVALTGPGERGDALLALATVWDQGWHMTGKKGFDAGQFIEAQDLCSRASGTFPETHVATAFLQGGACKLRGERAPTAAMEACLLAEEASNAALVRLPADSQWGWLHVEAAWAGVMAGTNRARLEMDPRGEAGRAAAAVSVVARCRAVEGALSWAPVNGVELAEDCVLAAGMARDATAYLHWVGLLVGLNPDGAAARISKNRAARVYRAAAPECANMTVDAKRQPVGTRVPDDWSGYCSVAGKIALGCGEELVLLLASAGDRFLGSIENAELRGAWQGLRDGLASRTLAECRE